MGRNPDSPTAHNGSLQVGLQLLNVLVKGLALEGTEVAEEHAAENGVPNRLVDQNLGRNCHGLSARHLRIEHTVEVVASGSVAEEAEGAEADGAHGIVRCTVIVDEVLCQNISGGESDEGRHHLGEERLGLEESIVSGPKSHLELL